MATRWRKQIGKGPLKLNVSHSERDGLSHSWTAGTTNKKGLAITANSKRGQTISVRGTGLKTRTNAGSGLIKFLFFWILIPYYVLKYLFKAAVVVAVVIVSIFSS